MAITNVCRCQIDYWWEGFILKNAWANFLIFAFNTFVSTPWDWFRGRDGKEKAVCGTLCMCLAVSGLTTKTFVSFFHTPTSGPWDLHEGRSQHTWRCPFISIDKGTHPAQKSRDQDKLSRWKEQKRAISSFPMRGHWSEWRISMIFSQNANRMKLC